MIAGLRASSHFVIGRLTVILPALTSGNAVGSVRTNVGLLVTVRVKEVFSAAGAPPFG